MFLAMMESQEKATDSAKAKKPTPRKNSTIPKAASMAYMISFRDFA
jgi:hypothetical protein